MADCEHKVDAHSDLEKDAEGNGEGRGDFRVGEGTDGSKPGEGRVVEKSSDGGSGAVVEHQEKAALHDGTLKTLPCAPLQE